MKIPLLGLLFFSALALHAATETKASRPNLLLILIEDQGAQLGLLGTPGLSTPHMDALARDGVFFRQYYVA